MQFFLPLVPLDIIQPDIVLQLLFDSLHLFLQTSYHRSRLLLARLFLSSLFFRIGPDLSPPKAHCLLSVVVVLDLVPAVAHWLFLAVVVLLGWVVGWDKGFSGLFRPDRRVSLVFVPEEVHDGNSSFFNDLPLDKLQRVAVDFETQEFHETQYCG